MDRWDAAGWARQALGKLGRQHGEFGGFFREKKGRGVQEGRGALRRYDDHKPEEFVL
jgi:hypothetical protein